MNETIDPDTPDTDRDDDAVLPDEEETPSTGEPMEERSDIQGPPN